MDGTLRLEGIYVAEHWRDGKLMRTVKGHNGINLVGKLDILEAYFRGGVATDPWYMSLLDDTFTPDDATDDGAAYAADEMTDYDVDNGAGSQSTDRAAWEPDAATVENDGGTDYAYVENSTAYIDFDITAASAIDIYGIYLGDTAAKASTASVTWSSAAFSGGAIEVISGDTIKVKYKVRIAY